MSKHAARYQEAGSQLRVTPPLPRVSPPLPVTSLLPVFSGHYTSGPESGAKTFPFTHAQTECNGVHIHWQEWKAVGQELAMAGDTKIELQLAHLPDLATLALSKGYLFFLFPVYAWRSACARPGFH
jgi:hypothetical protein